MQHQFKDRVYIVTGAGHVPGIGSSVVQGLLDQDACVIVNGQNFDTAWHDRLSTLPKVSVIQGDIGLSSVQNTIIDTAMQKWARIDGVINNASTGAADFDYRGQLTRQTWQENFQTNCISVYELCMLCRPYLSDCKGSIVNIASRAAIKAGSGNNLAYAVAKSALLRLSQELALQLAPDVTVNSVSPGLVDSSRIKNIMGNRYETFEQAWCTVSKLPGAIPPDTIAETVLFCLGNRYMTGQNIAVCGTAAL